MIAETDHVEPVRCPSKKSGSSWMKAARLSLARPAGRARDSWPS